MSLKIVIDLNVLFSAFIKDSVTRKIIKSSNLDFYFPEIALNKIYQHKEEIIEKSGLSEEEFSILLMQILPSIKIISKEQTLKYWNEANEVMVKIDPEDIIFISAALYLGEEAIIWTNDEHFDKQNKVKTIKTKDLL